LLSRLLLELGLIVLLEATCTLDATWGKESKVAFGSLLKNNLNLKFFSTWRGAMASRNLRMNVKYRCNTQKHKEKDKMTWMRGRKRA
jgi:hypothetical protein